MKKNQSGVSMVSLVITIIVIIILAAVSFTGSQETIGRAGFSGFATDIDSVKTAFVTESIPTLLGREIANNNAVSEAQAYNFLAKGASTDALTDEEREHAWLSRAQAAAIPCTRIEKESSEDAIGIKLPTRTVNTVNATGVEMSYFITNKGDIFVWPPFARSDDGLFYVNEKTTVKTSGDYSPLPNTEITTATEAEMYKDGFTFVVNGIEIKVNDSNINTNTGATNITHPTAPTLQAGILVSELKSLPSIYYKDERNAESPEGLESKLIYQNNSDDGVPGVDTQEKGTN